MNKSQVLLWDLKNVLQFCMRSVCLHICHVANVAKIVLTDEIFVI